MLWIRNIEQKIFVHWTIVWNRQDWCWKIECRKWNVCRFAKTIPTWQCDSYVDFDFASTVRPFTFFFEIIWKKHLFEQYWLCESYSEYWYSSKHSMFDMLIHFENEAKWCATFEFETQFVELLLQKTKNAYISNDKVNAWCIVLMIHILKNEKQKNFEQHTNILNDMMTMMWNTSQSAIVFETTKTKWKQSSIDTDEMMKNNFISYTRENMWRIMSSSMMNESLKSLLNEQYKRIDELKQQISEKDETIRKQAEKLNKLEKENYDLNKTVQDQHFTIQQYEQWFANWSRHWDDVE